MTNGPTFDVLVIGAGMGGLCAAALLAKKRFSTLVVERTPRIGGRCSTLEYKGFKCITGVVGVEMGGIVEEVFQRVGAEFRVRPAGPPHYLINGRVCEVPQKGGMKKLLSAASDNASEVDKVLAPFSRSMGWMEPVGEISLKEWVEQYSRDRSILNVFQTMVAATMMVNADEVPAAEFFGLLKGLGGIRHFGFCPEGSVALPVALLKAIDNDGGELWTGAKAQQIIVEKGVVRGARISTKRGNVEVRANVVISNSGPVKTMELAGKESFDHGYVRELERNAVPAMIVCFQIASDEPLIELDYLLVTGARRVNALYQPTVVCPELAPTGKHLLLVGAGPASSLPPLRAKEEVDLSIEDLRELIPDFDRRAEILLKGTYYGGWPAMHCWPGRDLPQKTPVVNLYNVGDGVKPAGTTGLPSTAASALAVVEDIENRI